MFVFWDFHKLLTTLHLLIGRRLFTLPAGSNVISEVYDSSMDCSEVYHRTKHLNQSLDHFWKHWRPNYLLELRINHRHSHKESSNGRAVSVCEVVLIRGENYLHGLCVSRLNGVTVTDMTLICICLQEGWCHTYYSCFVAKNWLYLICSIRSDSGLIISKITCSLHF